MGRCVPAGSVVSSVTVDYPGVSNGSLASRVALGDLKQLSVPLAKATLIANRQASRLNIGEVFKFTWPELGIAQLVMRVVRVSYGTLTDGRVRLECVEDIFGMPAASDVAPTPTAWVSPLTVVGHDWDVSIEQTDGTGRSIPWSIRKLGT